MDIDTRVLHALSGARTAYGAVVEPLVLSTTFERATGGDFPHGYSYGRSGNPNRAALEQVMAAVENGTCAFAFASGSAATAALFQALSPGDHVIAPREAYYGTRVILEEIFGRWGLAASFVDMKDLGAVQAAVRKTTKMLWIETPSNPLLSVSDIAALARIARDAGAFSVLDNTVATPVLQSPFDLGCDFAMHSTTKAISGHSDVIGGVVVARAESELTQRLAVIQSTGGAIPSPFDCWLALRGLRTMPLRVRAQSATALQVARFLAEHPAVEACHYPGLPGHPQHALAVRQMHGGFGMLLSFQVTGGRDQAFAVKNRLTTITRATSLGGIESLIEHRASIEPATTRTPENLLRLSVGLESAADLIADLDAALRP
jgi:cystathionine gamma-synthase